MATESKVINNRYILRKQIGSGGMGVIYEAYDRLTQRIVAIKQVFLPEFDNSLSRLDNFKIYLTREFKTLASLRHPHIISVLDYGFNEQQQPFFTMELLKSPYTVLDFCYDKPYEQKVQLIFQITQALTYLHRRGVIHRDLKPTNILVQDNISKVLDFGLAMVQGQRSDELGIFGTPKYLAPEIIQGHHASKSSDIFSLGLLFFEILTGYYPFESPSMSQLLLKIMETEVNFSGTSIPDDMVHILKKMLAKNNAQRYQDAFQLSHDFYRLMGKLSDVESEAVRESFLQAADFVGREAELLVLQEALTKAKAGHGGTWLIGGESGVGKSRFLDEIRILALVQGFQVLRGQSSRQGQNTYQVWRDILKWYSLDKDLSLEDASILKTLIPEIEEIVEREIPNPTDIGSQASQERLIALIIRLIQKQTRPVLLILEDLQWVGAESATLLERLISIVMDLPIMIIGSYRDDENRDLPQQFPQANLLKLHRLATNQIETLVGAILGQNNPQVIEFLDRETRGNTFFIVEILRALAMQAGTLSRVLEIELPKVILTGGIEQIIQHRLATVPTSDYHYLKLAAVMGRQLDLQLLRVIEPTIPLETWLLYCSNHAILEVQDNLWHFVHDKIRESIIQALLPEEKKHLHQLIATGIERHFSTLKDQVPILLHHWTEAGNLAKEQHYALLAGINACQISSFKEALGFLQRSQELYTSLSMNVPQIQATLFAYLSDAHFSLGQLAEARTQAEECLKLLPESDPSELRLRAISNLGIIALRLNQYELALQQLEQSRVLAEAAQNQNQIATALYFIGVWHNMQRNSAEGKRMVLQSLEIRQGLNDQWWVARCQNVLGETSIEMQDYRDAHDNYLKALEIFQQMNDQWWISATLNNLGHSAIRLSNKQEALTFFQSAINQSLELSALPITLEAMGGVAMALFDVWSVDEVGELLGCVLYHPASDNEVHWKADYALKHLKASLPEDRVEQVLEKGRFSDLWKLRDKISQVKFG